MSTAKIIEFGDPVLREKATPVNVFHKNLRKKVDLIKNTLFKHDGGAALAAPQISLLKRIVVIQYMNEYLELLNPVILESSGSTYDFEGCLSLPGFFGKVERAKTITVSYQDRDGREHTLTRSDEMARCIQHEIDHLDGILYIDRMTNDYVINPDKNTKLSLQELHILTSKQSN